MPDVTNGPYGFAWGPALIERYWSDDKGRVVLGIKTDAGREVTVYVSPTGRSVRVYDKDKGELTPDG